MPLDMGRFPANIITDGSDEVASGMPYGKSSFDVNGKHETEIHRENNDVLKYGYSKRNSSGFNDEGSAMRYFYQAKASKKDRDDGLDMFEDIQVNDGRKTAINNAYQRGDTLRKNIHPTVKPVELMQYLVRLVTPKHGHILEPFAGSGSTGKAAMFENRERDSNYDITMIELTEEYIPIIKARCDYAINKYEYDIKKEFAKTGQLNLFDFIGDEDE